MGKCSVALYVGLMYAVNTGNSGQFVSHNQDLGHTVLMFTI
jgi:hypothetical protein